MSQNASSQLLPISPSDLVTCTRINQNFDVLQSQITALSAPATTTTTGTATTKNSGSLSNPMTAPGDMIYEGTNFQPARVPGNTSATRKFLRQTGTGVQAGTPGWDTLVVGDIPNLSSLYAATGFPGAYASVALSGQTASSGPTNIQHASAILPAGRYLIMVTAIVTATGTNNLTVTVAWNDGTAAESVTLGPSGMGTSPGRLEAVQHAVLNGSTNLTYQITISGGSGGTAKVWIDVVRLV